MKYSSFKAWFDDADMPVQGKDGVWIDMETGLRYEAEKASSKAAPAALKDDAQKGRETAKFFGGKALKGTAAQKNWAEKIRAEKISGMTHEQAVMACDPDGLLCNSKFWIEKRAKTAAQIAEFVVQQKILLAHAKELKAAGKADEYRAAAAKYNALTALWGF